MEEAAKIPPQISGRKKLSDVDLLEGLNDSQTKAIEELSTLACL